MKKEETHEEYSERMDALALSLSDACEGEDVGELIIVLTRLIVLALDQMEEPQRGGMIHVMKEYFKACDIRMEKDH
jgi:hypothetical protein